MTTMQQAKEVGVMRNLDSPTEELKQEHALVLLVVEAMEREVAYIEAQDKVHAERVAQMVDFTRNFTDGCHHAKEERLLFPILEERSRTGAGQVSILLSEHMAGRDAVRAIADNLPRVDEDEAARKAVAENLGLYAFLLRLHINKEDTVLFPLADEVLSDQEAELLAEEFERVETEETGEGIHERYQQLAHELAEAPSD
jgi:hemerythrin-like domain-containing protein